MTATAAEALELALWLYRAPAHRNALLGRPLPEGIGQLLRVATGAEDALAAASRITGEPAQVVLEAVRFYLQQVLFHEDADAYRVLGLRSDASQVQAREHHRLLQHWLHPDRRDKDEWESVYAGRVNSAWTRLRTPQARQAYDTALSAQGALAEPARGPDLPVTGPIPVARWHVDPSGGHRDRGRSVAIGVLAGCVGLLVLIALRPEEPPQWVEAPLPPRMAAEEEAAEDARPFAVFDEVLAREPVRRAPMPQVAPPTPPSIDASPPKPRVIPAIAAGRQLVQRPSAATAALALAPDTPTREPIQRPARTPVVPPAPVAAIALVPEARPVPIVLPEAPPKAASPEPAAIAPISDPLARMTQARDRARLVVAYLDDPQLGQPPVWNDVRTAQDAERIRKALHGRQGSKGELQLQLRAPQWRLSADGAHLDSGYRAASEQGRLDIDFVWREEQLLVRALSVVPAT